MKKGVIIISFVIAILCGSMVYFYLSTNKNTEIKKNPEKVVLTKNVGMENPIVIKYSEYNGQPIEIVYDSIQKRISLRVHEDYVCGGDKELQVLKTKVSEICTSEKIITIGNSGYSLCFLGGFPEWSPYHSLGPNYSNACLLFSSKTTLKNKVFYITGENNKRGYYPYADSVGTTL
ncbi:MAG: hypothetical protein Q8Q67_00345 [bacterium]|nr:hypothetical protein [bacterium]